MNQKKILVQKETETEKWKHILGVWWGGCFIKANANVIMNILSQNVLGNYK